MVALIRRLLSWRFQKTLKKAPRAAVNRELRGETRKIRVDGYTVMPPKAKASAKVEAGTNVISSSASQTDESKFGTPVGIRGVFQRIFDQYPTKSNGRPIQVAKPNLIVQIKDRRVRYRAREQLGGKGKCCSLHVRTAF
jgi:hypothetical protein